MQRKGAGEKDKSHRDKSSWGMGEFFGKRLEVREMRKLLQCERNRWMRKGDVRYVSLWYPYLPLQISQKARKGLRPLEMTILF